MIVKHVPMRSLRRSSFAELCRYLTDPQGHRERLGDVSMTNCHSIEVEDALLEVLANQARNTRAVGDKTYHLIISFRAGEQPAAPTLAAIEERICLGLGFGEHQRLSVVHHDTDNLHIHVAINKIHPTRLTMHEPFRAYRTLAALSSTLEVDFGLERDNHQAQKRGAENKVSDMESATGIESLTSWIKRECLPKIQQAQSWDALHQVLQDHGLTLQVRGNGLVIQAGDGMLVKASSVARDLSKGRLEKRLGVFQASPGKALHQPSVAYSPKPLPSPGCDTTELYAQYQQAQKEFKAQNAAARARARIQRDRAVESAKAIARLKRGSVRLMVADGKAKRFLYAQTHQVLRGAVESACKVYRKEVQGISSLNRQLSWREWLQQQAEQGDSKALAALRANQARQQVRGNTFTGTAKNKKSTATMPPEHVTKKGTLIYRVGDASVRDDGDCLHVSRNAGVEGLREALLMASKRYGQVLTVHGTDEFKEAVAQAAATGGISVRFTETALEQRRLAWLAKARAAGRTPPRSHRSHR